MRFLFVFLFALGLSAEYVEFMIEEKCSKLVGDAKKKCYGQSPGWIYDNKSNICLEKDITEKILIYNKKIESKKAVKKRVKTRKTIKELRELAKKRAKEMELEK